MKHLKKLSLLFVGFIIFSCTSAPEESPETAMSDEPEERWVTEEITEYKLLREEIFFPDGKSDSRKEYGYDEKGNLIEYIVLSGEGLVLLRTKQTYDNELLNKEELFDDKGLLSYTEFNYLDGLLSEESYFDAKGNLQSGSRYTYNSDNLRDMWVALDSNASPIMKTRYSYDEGKLVRLDYLTPFDVADGYTEYRYEGDVLVFEASYNSNGELEKKIIREIEDELPVKETTFFGSRVNRVNINTFDEQGLLVEREVQNRSGRMIQREVFAYQQFTREIQVLVEE